MSLSKILSSTDIFNLQVARWKARTDLIWLCNHVLGYKDVKDEIQGAFIRHLQKFPVPTPEQMLSNDRFERGEWIYKPVKRLYDLPGSRRVLILDPRGFLKTTCNVVAHTVQWIINYPDIAIMIVQATTEKAEDFLHEVKAHFQANEVFRTLFPEHVPQRKIMDWGTKKEFTTEARNKAVIRKERTVMTGSIDKGSAGYHFDVMKFSDIVESNNSRTVQQNKDIIRSFGMMENLLVRPDSWIDVEGTRYHNADLYSEIIRKQRELPPERRFYQVHVRGCYKKTIENPQFSIEELDLPDLLDESKLKPRDDEKEPDLRKISWWPERFPTDKLEQYRLDPVTADSFPTQKLNNPAALGGRIPFPVDKRYPTFITRKDFRENILVAHYDVSIDTAETQGARSNYTAITIGAWDSYGRCYIVEICHGKFNPDEIIEQTLRVVKKYRPRTVKIEETSFVRGLMSSFRRYMDLRQVYIPFEFIKRDNQTAKEERILNTLQPWYKSGELRFVEDFGQPDSPEGREETHRIRLWLQEELKNFPFHEFNDILDTLSDLFQGKKWFGREAPRPNPDGQRRIQDSYMKQAQRKAWDHALGLDDPLQPGGETSPPSPYL